MPKLALIRHGQSQWNFENRFTGWVDVPLTEKGIKEKIIRNTLTKIAIELKEYTTIKRCHKSYIINTKLMDSISGNARGYYLISELNCVKIPVSRSFKKEEIESLIQ